ncbi:LPD23 domain-containing protein [uncultured Ruminococcus sp.]|uniref:LPD23 domain-containing protein n=1 Tax=uncultured Ruminococcus sp. TaxID=165186 RepID=UPI0025F7F739|nr:LPD23 domain-containing protein [uncultured Ruminococcus sp.]
MISNIDKTESERLNQKLRDIVTGKYQSPAKQRNNFFSTHLDSVGGEHSQSADISVISSAQQKFNATGVLPGAEKILTMTDILAQAQAKGQENIEKKNAYYAEKYKDTPKTYEGYMKHAQYVSSDERKWLEKQAEQYATAEDYKKEADRAKADYNYYKNLDVKNIEKTIDALAIQKQAGFLDSRAKIEKRMNEAQDSERIAESKMKEKVYAEKYKDTPKTYEGYMKHAPYVSEEERQWLESQADEFATSEDYKKEIEKAKAEHAYLYNIYNKNESNGTTASKSDAKVEDSIISKLNEISKYESKLRKKEYEEKTKDIIEGDARVRSIVQQYYAYQKNSEQRNSDNDEAVRIDLKSGNKYTPEQEQRIVENFNNLANEGYDPKALYTYYDRAMQEQASIENLQKIQQDAMNNPVGASAWSVLDNAVGSVGDAFKYIGAGVAEEVTGEYQWINTYDTAAARVNTVRSTVSDKIGADIGNETAGKVASFLYQTGMSLADFAATLPLNLVPGVGTGLQMVLLSTEAGTAAAKDAYEKTGKASNALMTGVAAGIAEAFFEKFSIENLKAFKSVAPGSVKSILKNAGKQMFTEASEEGLTTIANTLTDSIINGDMSAIALEYQGYIDEGYSEEEATLKCAESFAKQVALDAAGGAVSGGVLGGGVSAVSYAQGKINSNIAIKKSAQELGQEVMSGEEFDINVLLEQAKNSSNEKAENIAKSIEKKMSKNENYKVDSVDVGNLVKLLETENISGAVSENTDENEGENTGTEKKATANTESNETISKEKIEEHSKYKFGSNHKNGLNATCRKGNKVVIVGVESSSRAYGEADNKVRVIASDGRVYNTDSLTFNLPEYNILMNAAKNFDTNGAGTLVQEYGDYVNFKGEEGNVSNYISAYSELYEAGKMGGSYKRVANHKYYAKYIDELGPQRAIQAVKAGNMDSDMFFSNEDKLVRIDRSGDVRANVMVEESAEGVVNLDEGTRLALEKLSEMTGKDIILTADMDENGRIDRRDGKIYIRATLNGNYIMPVAMHESMHSIRKESPKDYALIRNFVVDYLFAKGNDVNKMIDRVESLYKDKVSTREDCLEEIVCNSIMAIAGDESAMKKALQVAKAEKSILDKLANAIKNLAGKIKNFILTHTTNEAAKTFVKDVEALDKLAEMFSNAADNIKAKSEEVITNEQKNNTDKGVDIKYSISDDVIKKFEIENINDYVHVQKQVLSTLNAENFFDDEGGKSKTVINKDSGMVIVINKKGIKETFNNKNYFNYSRNLKLAKLASIRKIPELIENGKLILDDEKNYHRNNSSIKYAYIVCETKINGKNANIKITVRKSPQNNKFWVHHIYIEKGTERTSAGTSKSSKTAFIPFGATNSISQSENNVNTKNDESSNDIKYSMGGLNAETADKSALEKAMKLEKDGTDSEKIRKETGWFKGYDGKWRFEIDNSELEFKTDIEKNRAAAIELAKMKAKSAEIEWKIVNDTATEAEENEYYSLDEKMVQLRKWQKLSDVINHPKLFKAYPQLKDVNVYYEISSLNRGLYSSKGNVIRLNPMCPIGEQKEIIIHEIQHAIQRIEDFANGSSLEYWENLGYSDEEAMAMYYNTAGEREARDVSARRDYNAEQRKNIRPDIDRDDVVFANSGESGYSSDENIMQDDFENKVVYPNMEERQRAQILRNERIKLSSYDSKNALSPDDVASLENSVKRNAFKILRELGTKFKVYKNYTNENIELDFDYSKSGLKESIDKQGNITTNYTDFAKMLTVFDDVIRNAVPIEVHTDKYVGTKRENPDLKYDYVLLSAFTDDNYIVPVELHIKEYKESYRINNKLYVSITLGKIKNEDNIITGSLLKNNNEVANSVPLSSEVSIPQLVSKVNEKLGNFYKYLPDELLSETQLKYKKIAAEKDRQRLSTMRNKTIQTENKSDIKYATDDTINDWLDDESTPQGIDYEKAVEKNPVIAVAKIYKSAAQTAKSGLAQGKNVKLDEKEYLRIAGSIMQTYGIKGKYNPNYKKELASQLKNFVDSIGKKDANFTDLFEELVNDCKGGILLSGEYDTTLMKDEREFVLDMLQGKVLLIKPRDVQQIEEDYGSVANYRKKMFGKTYVAVKNKESGKGYYIEDVITHIEENYPYLLNENADGDMGYLWLEDLVNNVLMPKYKNPYFEGENSFYETPETAAIQMAFECASKIINAKTEKLKADTKADKKLIKEFETSQKEAINIATEIAEAKNKQYRQELKEAKERNTELWKRNAKLSQEKKEEHRKRVEHSRELFSRLNKEKSKVRVEKNKNAYSNKIIEAQKAIIASHYKTIREEYNEGRNKTEYLHKLGRMCDRLTKRLDGKAKNNEYIPDNLKGPIIDVLSCFTVKDAKNATPGYFGEWNRIKEVGESVAELAKEYNNMKPEPTPSTDLEKKEKEKPQNTFIDLESISYKEPVNEQLKNLAEMLEGQNIYTLTSHELSAIYDTMQMLDESLRDAVQIIVDGRKQNFKELANEAMQEVKNNKARVDYSKMKNVLAAPAKQLGKSYITTHLDPVRYGRMLSNYHDDSIIYKLFSGLHEGENKAITIQQKAISRIKEVTLKYEKEIKGIQNEDVKEFDFRDVETGRRVPITKGVLLAIYLTDRQKSGHIHLLGGTEETYANEAGHYTVLPNLELSNKKLKRTANENSHKVRFNVESLKRIEKYVQNDKILMELATAISEVYNQTLKQEINEVSMAKNGMKIATVKDYYPLKVDPNAGKYEKNLKTEFHDTRLKSRGFTKQRQWSDTPIVIDDALRNFVKQVKSVSEYCGLLIPIENFKKVYNYSDGSATLQSTIKERYGVSAEHYIDKLIGDLQNRADTIDNTFLDTIQSNYMGMKIMFNMGSMIKQLSAFPLANRYFGAKNVSLAALNLFRNKVDFDLYNKYTSYLWYRKEGNGTVVGELSREMSLVKKWQDTFDFVGKMDNRVVASLLYAAELHVEQTTDLKKGTDAFYREVARQFEKCIDETQPNNMVTSKPQYLRNKNLRRLSLNAFRSQNMAIGNTIFDSFFEMKARMADDKINSTAESKAAKKAAVLKFVSCCSGAISANLLLGALSVLSSVILYHHWDDVCDDEGNISGEKIALNYLDEVLNGIYGSFAMGDYLYSAVSSAIDIGKTYYGLQVMSVDSINDMVNDVISGKALDALKTLLDCLGIPGTNIARFGSSIYAYYNDVAKGSGRIITDSKGNVVTDYLHYYIVEDKKDGNSSRAEYYESMWKEILMDKGKTESEATDYIKSKIVTALSADDDIEEAGVAKANGNLADYEKYRQKVIDCGFDSKDVQKAIDRFIKSEAKLVSEIEGEDERKQELMDNDFNENGTEYVLGKIETSQEYDDESKSTSAFDETSGEDELVMYSYSDLFDALINGDTENYDIIEKYMIEKGGKTKQEIESAMRSASRTDKVWAEYIEASTSNDRERTKELVEQLTRIYGSWSKAKSALTKYRQKNNK